MHKFILVLECLMGLQHIVYPCLSQSLLTFVTYVFLLLDLYVNCLLSQGLCVGMDVPRNGDFCSGEGGKKLYVGMCVPRNGDFWSGDKGKRLCVRMCVPRNTSFLPWDVHFSLASLSVNPVSRAPAYNK